MTHLPEQTGFLINESFSDVDDLTHLVREWDLDFRQLSRGGFRGELLQFGNQNFQFARTRLEALLHQRGSTPPELRTFAIPMLDNQGLNWRGHEIAANQMLVFPVSGELESTSSSDFDMLVLSISSESLDAAFRRAGARGIEPALAEVEVICCEPLALAALRRWGQLLTIEAGCAPRSILCGEAMTSIEERACDLLVQVLATKQQTRARLAQRQRARQTEEAVSLARRTTAEVLTVAQLCRAVGVSERTLRRGFTERFGVSPKAFLKAQSLIGLRRALRASNPRSTQVTEVASRFGLWHLGQLAADYQRHFGELPSETLRRS